MYQTHPLDANGRLLRRFYEPLVLLGALDPTRGAERPDLVADRGIDGQQKLWRNFLDRLAWLCDSEKGGDTVTAVACQKIEEHSVFWVAANSKFKQKSRDHLNWMLSSLNSLYAAEPESIDALENTIWTRCIAFSCSRIKTYTAWLLHDIKKAREGVKQAISSEDRALLEAFVQVESLSKDPHQLCSFAYQFRKDETMQILSKRHNAHLSRGIWSNIRHHIGRLGSWSQAVHVLVHGAQTFPQHIENARVEFIEPRGLPDLPSKAHLTNLQDVIKRMIPADKTLLAQDLNRALSEIDAIVRVEAIFRDHYSGMKPRPHAELLVLEHFYDKELEFVMDDKYIGCSKPSCYCCHLYMQCHPCRFTPRPCHGNLWINWAPPLPLPLIVNGKARKKSALRPQEHHTFQMLQRMIPRIREDLQGQITSRRPRRQKLPDSTTGISSIGYEFEALQPVVEGFRESRERQSNIATLSSLQNATIDFAETKDASDDAVDGDSSASSRSLSDDINPLHNVVERGPSTDRDTCVGGVDEDCSGTEDDDVLVFRGRKC